MLSSCQGDGWLDRTPYTQTSPENFYRNAAQFRLAAIGAYEAMNTNSIGGYSVGGGTYYSGLPITSIAVVLTLVIVLHTVLRNRFAVALHVAMFVVGTLFVTNIQVKKPRNSTLAVLVGVVALAILKIFHIF